MSTVPTIALRDVSFSYENNHGASPLFLGFSLDIAPGTLAILGASGSGKSTLAKLLARIVLPQDGEVVCASSIQRLHDLVYLDQEPLNGVFPWHRVKQNLEYPLRKRQWSEAAISERVSYLLDVFRLTSLANAYPKELSGGEKHRLAVASALSWKPKCAILDESFSQLDPKTRHAILSEIRQVTAAEGMTLIMITHSLGDALAVAERYVLLGQRPVEIIANEPIQLEFPREEHSSEYQQLHRKILATYPDAIL